MKNIDKNIVMLGMVSFFTDMASAMINPILPIFVVSILQEGMDKLGIIVAAATFVSYALRLISGYISDKYGIVKPLVVSGYALSAISKPLVGFSGGYKSVAALRAFERLGKALRSAPKDLIIANYSVKKHSGRTFGFHKTLDIAGELGGTLLLFGILFLYGGSEEVIRNVFYLTLVPGLIGLFIVAFFVKDVKKDVKKSVKFNFTKRDIKTVKSLFFYFFFIFFVFNEAFFTIQAKSIGIATAVIPLLFVVSTGIQTLTSYTLGIWIDKIGMEKIMLFAYLSAVLALLFLYLKEPLFTWMAYGFLGLFSVSSLNANRSLIATRSDNKGSVYGIFYAGVALFGALGAYVCGLVWEYFDLNGALLFSIGGSVFVLILFLIKNFRYG